MLVDHCNIACFKNYNYNIFTGQEHMFVCIRYLLQFILIKIIIHNSHYKPVRGGWLIVLKKQKKYIDEMSDDEIMAMSI